MKNKPNKKYSLYTRIIRIFVIVCAVFYIVIGFTLVFFHNTILLYTTESYTKTIEKGINQFNNELEATRKFYSTVLFNNLDLASLASTESDLGLSLCKSRLSQYLSTILPTIPNLDGLFFYANKTDSFVSASLDHATNEHTYFKKLLRSDEFGHIYEGTTKTYKKWVVTEIDDSYFLVRMASYNGCIAGAWINISSFFGLLGEALPVNSIYYFIGNNNDGPEIISSTENIDLFSYDPINNNEEISLNGSDDKYLQITNELPFLDSSFISLIPIKDIQSSMASFYRFLIFLLFINIIILLFLFTIMRRYMSLPVAELRRISENLKEGDDDYLCHIRSDSVCKEVCEVQMEVIKLYQKIFDLNNRVLNEQLMKQTFELKSLRNQVSPHFLINCLNTISAMASTNVDRDLMKRVIASLSGHLRYTLSTKPFVSLSEEIQHVENYFELANLRYPGSLEYTIKIHDLCDNASIFPSLILMLSENSIKHNMVMGELLSITISVREEKGPDGEDFIHIVHYDTGRGYPEDILEKLNFNSLNPSEIADGNGIGLYNIVNRIHLIYGNRGGMISFANHENHGAKIDVLIPYIPYQES